MIIDQETSRNQPNVFQLPFIDKAFGCGGSFEFFDFVLKGLG